MNLYLILMQYKLIKDEEAIRKVVKEPNAELYDQVKCFPPGVQRLNLCSREDCIGWLLLVKVPNFDACMHLCAIALVESKFRRYRTFSL